MTPEREQDGREDPEVVAERIGGLLESIKEHLDAHASVLAEEE